VDATFEFDDKVPALNKSLIQDGIAIGRNAFGPVRSLTVYSYGNLDTLIDAYCRHSKIAADSPAAIKARSDFQNGISQAFATPNGAIFVYVNDAWLRSPRSYQQSAVSHEYFHVVQRDLSKLWSSGTLMPKWLVEGSNVYLNYQIFIASGSYTTESTEDYYRDMVWGLTSPLSSVETSDQVRAEDNNAMYILGYLASEYLAQNYGELTIRRKYWEALGTARTWQDAFRTTYGLSVEDFNKKFEEYRQTNFPPLCRTGGDLTTLGLRFDRQVPPGSFFAFPKTYIPYVFCASVPVGAWTPKQREDGFKKPAGVNDPRISYCGGSCVVLAVRPDTPSGTYVFAVEAPDGKKAEATFQYVNNLATATPRP